LSSGGGSQDVLDDNALYLAVKSFLESPSDHAMPESQHGNDADALKSWTSLRGRLNTLSATFISQTLRPSIPKPPIEHRTTSSGVPIFVDLPDLDRTTPEELVNELNSMAAAAFRNITEEVSFQGTELFSLLMLRRIFSLPQTSWRYKTPIELVGSCQGTRALPMKM
jgi:GTPase-activating protein BEM2